MCDTASLNKGPHGRNASSQRHHDHWSAVLLGQRHLKKAGKVSESGSKEHAVVSGALLDAHK